MTAVFRFFSMEMEQNSSCKEAMYAPCQLSISARECSEMTWRDVYRSFSWDTKTLPTY